MKVRVREALRPSSWGDVCSYVFEKDFDSVVVFVFIFVFVFVFVFVFDTE